MEITDIRSNEDLIALLKNGTSPKYIFFWGHTVPKDGVAKTCFSQWYPAEFSIDGIKYPTAEHYMMAEKARLFNDTDSLERILNSRHPRQAKQLGRGVVNFNDKKWNEMRFKIVVAGNVEKFRQNDKLKEFLLATGKRVIVEASPTDRVWGIGLAQDHQSIESPEQWRGLNLLGYALMEARAILQQ